MTATFIFREVLKSAAAVLVGGFLYVWFLTTPVLSSWLLNNRILIGLLVAFMFGTLCRIWITNFSAVAISAFGALIGGAIWAEVHFGQHDIAVSSSWLYVTQNAIEQLWSYNTIAFAAILAGWFMSPVMLWPRVTRR